MAIASPEDVLRLAHMCKASYDVDASGHGADPKMWSEEVTKPWKIIALPENDGQMILAPQSDRVTIVLRGTANAENARDDVKVRARYDELLKCKVHRGFKEVADEAFNYLRDNDLLQRDVSYEGAGHSLGGAGVFLLMAQLATCGYPVRQVVTYGQPKVTRSDTAKKLSSLVNLTRVVNGNDLVPRLPATWLITGVPSISCIVAMLTMGRPYGHADSTQVIHLNAEAVAAVEPEEDEVSFGNESVVRVLLRKLFKKAVASAKHAIEHPIARYIEMLEQRQASLTNAAFVNLVP